MTVVCVVPDGVVLDGIVVVLDGIVVVLDGIVVVIDGIDVVVDGVVVVTDAIIYIYIYYIISAILANNPNSVIIDISAIIKNIS